jgi:hypothetical protein
MKKTNVIYESTHVGVEAITIHNARPHFFLFAELDNKDPENLRDVIHFFKSRRLAFLWYETKKGWHVISPCLYSLREWDLAKKQLAELIPNYYRNLAIRIDRKQGDSHVCFWENSTYPEEHKISSSLLTLFELKFDCFLPSNDTVKTKLFYVKYKQTRMSDIAQ